MKEKSDSYYDFEFRFSNLIEKNISYYALKFQIQ